MSDSQSSTLNKSTQILILGCGEIARHLTVLASQLGYMTTVCDDQLEQHSWPASVNLVNKNFNHEPWPLPALSHAIIARGHDEDIQSVVNLLHHQATHVYLIASGKRADSVIQQATSLLNDKQLISRISAPAGLDLGGNSSTEIALSILAELQWRSHQCKPSLQPLTALRDSRLNTSISRQRYQSCPGKRP